jgi:hypothetical protein
MSLALAFMLAASSTNPQTCIADNVPKDANMLKTGRGLRIGGQAFKREDVKNYDVLFDSESDGAALKLVLSSKGTEKLAKLQKERKGQSLPLTVGRFTYSCLAVETESPIAQIVLSDKINDKNVWRVVSGLEDGWGRIDGSI